jgi:hypothetical protein
LVDRFQQSTSTLQRLNGGLDILDDLPSSMEALHIHLKLQQDNEPNPTLDLFCKSGSPFFPDAPKAEGLGASYEKRIMKPFARTLAIRRGGRPHETADEFLGRECHDLVKTLESLAREKNKTENVTEHDILDALRAKFVSELDAFPNTIDLSYTLEILTTNGGRRDPRIGER